MKTIRALCTAILALLLAAAARAQFEGIAEMKGTTRTGRGEVVPMKGKVWVSRGASRFEWAMEASEAAPGRKGAMAMRMNWVTIQKASEPGVVYMLNVEGKTYSVIHAGGSGETDAKTTPPTFTVTRLGRDTVAGLSCEKALLKRSGSGDETEVCVSKELASSGAWLDAMARRERGGGLFRALSDAGLSGFPIRWLFRHSGEREAFSTMELTRLEKTSVPASTFEIPAGYRKVSAGEGAMTPEQEEAKKKALERMTPEQRKQYEEMMKKQRGDP